MTKNTTPTEYEEAKIFVNYLKELKRYGKIQFFCHIINETPIKNIGFLMKQKAQGWNKGVHDYLILTNKEIVFVELKRLKGYHIYEEQVDFSKMLDKIKIKNKICIGSNEAINFINTLI